MSRAWSRRYCWAVSGRSATNFKEHARILSHDELDDTVASIETADITAGHGDIAVTKVDYPFCATSQARVPNLARVARCS